MINKKKLIAYVFVAIMVLSAFAGLASIVPAAPSHSSIEAPSVSALGGTAYDNFTVDYCVFNDSLGRLCSLSEPENLTAQPTTIMAGSAVAYLSYSWAAYFKGVYGPALFILVVGASFLAIYLIFGVAGIGKDIVEVG